MGSDFRRTEHVCAGAIAIAIAVLASSIGVAPTAFAAPKAAQYTFAFKDADISQVAEEVLGHDLGVAYLIDPEVSGKMSFRIEQRLTPAQLLEAFEAALSANEVALVRSGDTLVLKPYSKARESAPLRAPGEAIHRSGYEVAAVPLNFASATEVAKALESISPGKMVLYANDKTGLILLGGSGQELASALQSIKLFDQNGLADAKIRWFELTQSPAQTVADDLKRILESAGVGGVSVVPLKRLNGLFVFARTPEALDQTARWVTKLDVPSKEKSVSIWTYKARNVAADDLAQSLGGLLGDHSAASSSSTPQPATSGTSNFGSASSGFGSGSSPSPTTSSMGGRSPSSGPASVTGSLNGSQDTNTVRVSVDRNSNVLLISSSAADWVALQKMLEELDHAPAEILIEASIIEVTLTKDFKFGIDWTALGGNGRFTAQNLTNGATSVAANAPGFAVTYLDQDIKAALNTLDARTAVHVISAPKIIALDNRTATLQVGDQVPIITQSQQSTSASAAPLVNSVDYRNTGVIMSVTPRISGDDKISISVSQEVSSVSQTTSSGINSPTIQQRRFDSALLLNNGGTVALGGLISSSRTTARSGIPFLGSLPGVGAAFRGDTTNDQQTELIVLLSAKIIRTQQDADHALTDLLADMSDIKIHPMAKRR